MKTKPALLVSTGIGALELKQQYQRNMFLAVLLAFGAAFAVIGAIALYTLLSPAPIDRGVRRFVLPTVKMLEPAPAG